MAFREQYQPVSLPYLSLSFRRDPRTLPCLEFLSPQDRAFCWLLHDEFSSVPIVAGDAATIWERSVGSALELDCVADDDFHRQHGRMAPDFYPGSNGNGA